MDEVPESGVIKHCLESEQRSRSISSSSSLSKSLKLRMTLSSLIDQKTGKTTSCHVISSTYFEWSIQPKVSSESRPDLESSIEKAKTLSVRSPYSITESKKGTCLSPLCLNLAAICGYAKPMMQSKCLSKASPCVVRPTAWFSIAIC